MGIGVSLFLLAVGAILYFAVNATVSGLSIATVGVILMAVGGIGLLFSLLVMATGRRTVYERPVDRPVVRDEYPL